MRHIVAHLLRGEAGKAHAAITQDLAIKFDSFPLHERIVPHITLKRWFDLDNDGMQELYQCLDSFAETYHQSDYKLSGFGHFGEDVIYANIEPSPGMLSSVKNLKSALHSIKDLTFDEFDDHNNFHATVAMGALKPFDFSLLWNYLQGLPRTEFNMKFDNVAILKKLVDKWVVDRVWELK
ncbi:MAG: hypothetical protein COV10_03465 [Candidatus Vogelbacteria bacterium CG10_big_fil_rev_8_21_14_0_10_51_16]|uniref:Phosphoesterase HXTX domain-containing protein n=1 Tax=Candidatus Vogelbacteria bacterium CG10_big_fil_rev_8_21_14_0_10_51_16 TaxID=1975045 RepID=A0A2H0RDU2_9BACT|nr:MAG: hypothetical protein COV10_03465 [Candidatus Vogelbacteria bacterium CG10_big_fil_rev_8_21_14_0_10_51_16]